MFSKHDEFLLRKNRQELKGIDLILSIRNFRVNYAICTMHLIAVHVGNQHLDLFGYVYTAVGVIAAQVGIPVLALL